MRRILITFFTLAISISQNSLAASYGDKEIGYLRSPDNRNCTLFQLVGVAKAGTTEYPWFALPNEKTNGEYNGYNDKIAMLLAAKISGKRIDVSVSDKINCGHAEVTVIGIP